jgi:homoserine O-succinyltransferase
MFNHVEYDTTSLADEYFRDIQLQPDTPVPANYFPSDDASRKPQNCWRGHAHLLFGNWINEMYQSTPYDLAKIGKPD